MRTCNSIDFQTWTSKTNKDTITRIEKVNFKIGVPLEDGSRNTITFTDFDIYSVDKPKRVTMRIVNDYYLESLRIDGKEISRIAESIPIGLEIAIDKLDSLKKACR